MEQIKMPTIEQTSKEKTEQKNPFEILTSELAGKTRDELTPEQCETEDAYREKCFRDLMQLINDDKVLAHGTRNLESVLNFGILSDMRLSLKQYKHSKQEYDPVWQEKAEIFLYSVTTEFLTEYQKYKKGVIIENEFNQYTESVIDKFPELGKERARYYFENVIPIGFNKGWFGIDDWVEGNPIMLSKTVLRKLKKQELTGLDMISSSTSYDVKREFLNHDLRYTYLGSPTDSDRIFFERPSEDKLMNLHPRAIKSNLDYDSRVDREDGSSDIGVASKVRTGSFRSIWLSNMFYDESCRVLYILKTSKLDDNYKKTYQQVSQETLSILKERQEIAGLTLFDDIFQPLSLIESINVVNIPYTKEEFDTINCLEEDPNYGIDTTDKYKHECRQRFETFMAECGENNPRRLYNLRKQSKQQAREKIEFFIKENYLDWYEKYRKSEWGW